MNFSSFVLNICRKPSKNLKLLTKMIIAQNEKKYNNYFKKKLRKFIKNYHV